MFTNLKHLLVIIQNIILKKKTHELNYKTFLHTKSTNDTQQKNATTCSPCLHRTSKPDPSSSSCTKHSDEDVPFTLRYPWNPGSKVMWKSCKRPHKKTSLNNINNKKQTSLHHIYLSYSVYCIYTCILYL